MWLNSMTQTISQGSSQFLSWLAALLMIGVVALSGIAGRGRELMERASAFSILVILLTAPFFLMGAAGRIQVESVIASAFGASVRFLMPHRQPMRTVFAGYLAAIALAQWGVPTALPLLHAGQDLAPVLGFIGGLAGLEICRLLIEVVPEALRRRFGKEPETA